jgi:hypothetical protein
MFSTRKTRRRLSWVKKLLAGGVAVAGVAAAGAAVADAAGEAAPVADVAGAVRPGVYPGEVATPVRRDNSATVLMKASDEGRALLDPALFLFAAW